MHEALTGRTNEGVDTNLIDFSLEMRQYAELFRRLEYLGVLVMVTST